MSILKRYSIEEIRQCLKEGKLPISGITRFGSTEFHFREPASYVGVALHNGNRVGSEVLEAMEVGQEERFREEDPHTDSFIQDFPLKLIARDSRFEYDLNREPHRSIYPFDALKWGLKVWCREVTPEEHERSLSKHQEFHDLVDLATLYMLRNNKYAVIFDMHSYCYQREEKQAWYKDSRPEINLGSKSVNKELFNKG